MPEGPDDRANAAGIFHVNLNCTDLERSTAFYELIGLRTVLDFDDVPRSHQRGFDEIGLAPILRPPEGCEARARLLMLGADERIVASRKSQLDRRMGQSS